ncbi:hypothetical protein ACQ4PT_058724 [Festuca glaucescens]
MPQRGAALHQRHHEQHQVPPERHVERLPRPGIQRRPRCDRPHLGTQAWVRSLGFPIVDDWRAWHLHGQSAGFTITYSNNMTFATVKGAGHPAPEFEPERCFAMFSRWILNQQL